MLPLVVVARMVANVNINKRNNMEDICLLLILLSFTTTTAVATTTPTTTTTTAATTTPATSTPATALDSLPNAGQCFTDYDCLHYGTKQNYAI